ncbi:MAG: DNA polymerase III subunit delta' [Halanaerobiaceae bacterium]
MSFSDIIGQQEAKKILKDELQSGRVSHAYLFAGEEGLGKKELALEFVKALLCGSEQLGSCDQCVVCRKIDHENHADVRLLTLEEESSSFKIDQVRDMQQELVYKPYEAPYKVYIIDSADRMTPEAANSLLQTLEEPPEYAVLILLAEEINQLLPTIISRCQQIYFYNVAREKIKDSLVKRGLTEEKAHLFSRLADGSPGRARELVEDEQFMEYREDVLGFIKELSQKSYHDIFNQAQEMEKYIRDDFPLLNLISSWYRDIILYTAGKEKQIVNLDYVEEIKNQASFYDIGELSAILEHITEINDYIGRNVNKELALDVLLTRIRSRRV